MTYVLEKGGHFLAKISTRLNYLKHFALHILSGAIAKIIGHVLGSAEMVKCRCFSILMPPPSPPHFNVVDVKAATRWT